MVVLGRQDGGAGCLEGVSVWVLECLGGSEWGVWVVGGGMFVWFGMSEWTWDSYMVVLGLVDDSVEMSGMCWDVYKVILKCLREMLSHSSAQGEFGPGNGQVV